MPSPSPLQATRRAATAALLSFALILVAACGLGPAAPTPTPTPAPSLPVAVAPSPTATATPTRPAPTATSTVTPLPATVADVPISTAALDAGAEEEQYLAAMADILGRWEAWSAEAGGLIGQVGEDPLAVCITRSGDIDAQIAGGRELLAALAAAAPPEEIAGEHNRLVAEGNAGLDALEAGKTALCRRLDTGTALTKMEEMNTHLVNAYAAAEALFAWAGEQ